MVGGASVDRSRLWCAGTVGRMVLGGVRSVSNLSVKRHGFAVGLVPECPAGIHFTAVCRDAVPRRGVGGAVSHSGARQAESSSPRCGVGFSAAGRRSGWRSECRSRPSVVRGDCGPPGAGGVRSVSNLSVKRLGCSDGLVAECPAGIHFTAVCRDAGPRRGVGGAGLHLGVRQAGSSSPRRGVGF